MKIAFDKIGTSPHPFVLRRDGLTIEGALRREQTHWISLSSRIEGELELDCDRCGASYVQALSEPLSLRITDTISQDKEDLDIIEFLDGVIDIDSILESEINALSGDYHFCANCAQSEDPIEIEY